MGRIMGKQILEKPVVTVLTKTCLQMKTRVWTSKTKGGGYDKIKQIKYCLEGQQVAKRGAQ